MKDGTQRSKRAITLGDESKVCIEVSLWGEVCEARAFQVGQVIALKSCRISDFSGRSLNASGDPSDIIVDVKHTRADELVKFCSGSSTSELKS